MSYYNTRDSDIIAIHREPKRFSKKVAHQLNFFIFHFYLAHSSSALLHRLLSVAYSSGLS